jgi:hypothetical protein
LIGELRDLRILVSVSKEGAEHLYSSLVLRVGASGRRTRLRMSERLMVPD